MRVDSVDIKGNILVIDDDLAPRQSVLVVLKDEYNVSTATGAYEGLEYMSQNPVDLVVMDVRMPEMDGITALQEIKRRHLDTEVILLTAYANLDTARDAMLCGAYDYLIKPFDKDELLLLVKRGLEKSRASKNLRIERESS
jgi:two-component system response regulator AtoC